MLLVDQHSDTAIRQRLTAELGRIEQRFNAELASDLACVNRLVEHVGRYRGKMLRPTLVLVAGLCAARPGQELGPAHSDAAVVVELTHMATLVHDDILDEAQMRRKGATVNRLEGNETAVMLGDYLFSHAFHLCSRLHDCRVTQVMSRTTNIVCEGELLQLANRNNWDLTEETYFDIIRRKTAALCAVSCHLGAMLTGADDAVCDALAGFGQHLGMAYQIVDDLLDLTGDQATVGKTLGRDLQKGKLTLAMIHGLRAAGPGGRQTLLAILEQHGLGRSQGNGHSHANDRNGLDAATADKVRELLTAHGSLEFAKQSAVKLIQQAQSALSPLPDSPMRNFLTNVAQAVVTRRS